MRCSFSWFAWVAMLVAAFCAPAVSRAQGVPNRALLDDLADGRLDELSLLQAAGAIGGMDRDEITAAQSRLKHVVASLDRERRADGSDRLEGLLCLLHDRIFTGRYDASASQISAAIGNGDYNCASAAVVFLVVADLADVRARPLLLPGHVRCRVWLDDQQRWIDVEPSVRDGKPDETTSPPSAEPRQLTDVQLLAKLYYNLGLDQHSRRDYFEALKSARYARQFDRRHAAARDNVAAIINNWSLALCRQQQFDRALALVRAGISESPADPLLPVNEVHIYVAWMQQLMQRGDLRSVELRLHDALARYPTSSVLRDIDWRLREARAQSVNSARDRPELVSAGDSR
jgi:tetratricopeptide (TPR) repeat protein